ncbi:MAG TPA: hypothetical protein VF594_12370 [Rubricoccaceae bacterium]|jgi:hypothetical protein
MPQTLLVVAAVILLAVFGLNRHRSIAADERSSIGREIEAAALAVGERWTGLARDLAFDEADVSAVQMRLQGNVAGLTAAPGREAGETLADVTTLDDVDDLHGLSVTESAAVAEGAVSFRVTATTGYAVPGTWATVASPTTAKIVTLTVREVTTGPTQRPPVVLTLPVRVSAALQFVHNN